MKLHFLGANRQVTGSRYCVETRGTKILVDCGMFQERAFLFRNWETCPIPADQLDAVLLTHVHIDHSGLLPKLVDEGFHGPIYATRATAALADPMLRDAAEIQEEDAAYKRKRHAREGRRGKFPELPLYTEESAARTLQLFQPVPYGRELTLGESVRARFLDAGHILGSAMLQLTIAENGRPISLLFSGDIGQQHRPLLRDPTLFDQADYVVMESTYGDREHEDGGDVEDQLERVIHSTFSRGGNVVIPTFAVERAQELMYHLSRLVRTHRIPHSDVYLDSPMAVDVTEIYRRFPDCMDEESQRLMSSNEPPLRFPGLRFVRTVEESKAINEARQPAVIMATSGMCNAGRIKHHLRQNISRPESTILFVGYQAEGTLGRQILERQPFVRIHGRDYRVRAEVAQIFGFSGHADRSGLLGWIGHLNRAPKRIFLCHGEEQAAQSLAAEIRVQHGWEVTIPEFRETVELAVGEG